jgi:hypothetical protein
LDNSLFKTAAACYCQRLPKHSVRHQLTTATVLFWQHCKRRQGTAMARYQWGRRWEQEATELQYASKFKEALMAVLAPGVSEARQNSVDHSTQPTSTINAHPVGVNDGLWESSMRKMESGVCSLVSQFYVWRTPGVQHCT